MKDITTILAALERGDCEAADQLWRLLYGELRRLALRRVAGESPDLTLQPTALVHEAYIRLVDRESAQHWNSRGHFLAAAAEAMRRILVEHARAKRAQKRGRGYRRLHLTEEMGSGKNKTIDVLALDEALAKLALVDARKARLVELRYFAGCSMAEAAKIIGISLATAKRDWVYARAWLYDRLQDSGLSGLQGRP